MADASAAVAEVAAEDKEDKKEKKDEFFVPLEAIAPIAAPLAGKKLSKKLFKTVKKGELSSSLFVVSPSLSLALDAEAGASPRTWERVDGVRWCWSRGHCVVRPEREGRDDQSSTQGKLRSEISTDLLFLPFSFFLLLRLSLSLAPLFLVTLSESASSPPPSFQGSSAQARSQGGRQGPP